jgi:thiamine-phosphate pyrophosphorylase
LKLNLPTIYPITDTAIAKFSHAEQVRKLIEGGATLIQLRDKHASAKGFYQSAKDALEIAREFDVRIIINDRVDIALALKAYGVHLGQEDLPPAHARNILGDDAIIGFSTHNLKQAIEAVKLPINYLAIGPVFTTRTKENPENTIGLEGIKNVRAAVGGFPIVAIGGVTLKNFREVLAAGANTVAVISDIISEFDKISRKTREFLNIK